MLPIKYLSFTIVNNFNEPYKKIKYGTVAIYSKAQWQYGIMVNSDAYETGKEK